MHNFLKLKIHPSPQCNEVKCSAWKEVYWRVRCLFPGCRVGFFLLILCGGWQGSHPTWVGQVTQPTQVLWIKLPCVTQSWTWKGPLWVMCVCPKLLSCLWLFANPWTVAHQVPLSLGFYRQEYWSGLPCPPPRDLPNPGIEPVSLMSPALAGRFLTPSATWETPAGSVLHFTDEETKASTMQGSSSCRTRPRFQVAD